MIRMIVLAMVVALGVAGVAVAFSQSGNDDPAPAVQLDGRTDDAQSDLDPVDDGPGDGDDTKGDDGTNGGNNTVSRGDGDDTAGDDGTSGGNNTVSRGDGDNTAGDDGTSGGNNTFTPAPADDSDSGDGGGDSDSGGGDSDSGDSR